mmetsp:Transcript_25279/g.60111  ORF Transcript_25279/g.60111 Transcript_25279/m.60111 type:complete len:355 (+) Transcript_25279:2688-3752(+)
MLNVHVTIELEPTESIVAREVDRFCDDQVSEYGNIDIVLLSKMLQVVPAAILLYTLQQSTPWVAVDFSDMFIHISSDVTFVLPSVVFVCAFVDCVVIRKASHVERRHRPLDPQLARAQFKMNVIVTSDCYCLRCVEDGLLAGLEAKRQRMLPDYEVLVVLRRQGSAFVHGQGAYWIVNTLRLDLRHRPQIVHGVRIPSCLSTAHDPVPHFEPQRHVREVQKGVLLPDAHRPVVPAVELPLQRGDCQRFLVDGLDDPSIHQGVVAFAEALPIYEPDPVANEVRALIVIVGRGLRLFQLLLSTLLQLLLAFELIGRRLASPLLRARLLPHGLRQIFGQSLATYKLSAMHRDRRWPP